MRLTRRQLRQMILKEARAMSIATVPGHPNPRTHETPTYQSGSFFTVRRQPMGKGYGRIAKDYLFYVQLDTGKSIRIPHQMHAPITSKSQAAKFINYLDNSYRSNVGEIVTLDDLGEIAYIINNSDFKSAVYKPVPAEDFEERQGTGYGTQPDPITPEVMRARMGEEWWAMHGHKI